MEPKLIRYSKLVDDPVDDSSYDRLPVGRQFFGKTVLITGGNSGIGYASAKTFASKGAKVIVTCRTRIKALLTAEQIKSEHEYERTYNDTLTASDLKLVPMELDLASFASAMAFINEFKRQQLKLDIMILNAGIAGVKKTMTCNGIESHFQVNYLTHFLICLHLIPIIDESKGIVITIASEAHRVLAKFKVNNFQGEKKYGRFEMYGNSKLFQVMSAFALERRLPDSNIKFVCMHPGDVTDTSLGQHISDMSVVYLMRQCFYAVSGCHVSDVAENIVEILKQREFEYHSDVYYKCRKLVEASPDARDTRKQDQLWTYSLNLLKLYLPTLPPHFQH